MKSSVPMGIQFGVHYVYGSQSPIRESKLGDTPCFKIIYMPNTHKWLFNIDVVIRMCVFLQQNLGFQWVKLPLDLYDPAMSVGVIIAAREHKVSGCYFGLMTWTTNHQLQINRLGLRDHWLIIYRRIQIYVELIEKLQKMSTYNWPDLRTLGSPPIMNTLF